ncbi:MAG: FtsQ-type POTRA domain-containing protein [Desulfobacterales bacterium]|nr:FtsQ-type POTRA domain-containing protein [Desulfobacterales bacterium]
MRKNRFKSNRHRQPGSWKARLLACLTLTALMLAVLGMSALCMAGYDAVTHAKYFQAQTITVSGQQRLTEAQILRQAGIRLGDNLLALNLRVVRERLLDHPWILRAQVTREIPNALAIRIEEHVALACLDLGRKFFIDTEGRIFKEVAKSDAEDLPLVSGLAFGDIRIGEEPPGSALAAVVQVLRICRNDEGPIAYGDIEKVYLDKELGVSLILKSDQRLIKLGFDDYEAKFERFRQLRDYLARNENWGDFQTTDLNNPERIVVQRAGTPEAEKVE